MPENTTASRLHADAPNAMVLAQTLDHDSRVRWGIMSSDLHYSDVQYYNFMNLFDLQDLISPSSEEEESARNIWSPLRRVEMEKKEIKNVQHSTSTPWSDVDKDPRMNSNCEANIKWPKNNIVADINVQAKTSASNPGKRALVPVQARVRANKNGESKRVRISTKDFVLPQGWITWKQERLNGRTAGNKDAHYMELSTKRRFRSRVEVKRYLQNKQQENQMSVLDELDDRHSQPLITVEESYGLQAATASSISTDHDHGKKTLTREKIPVRRPKKSAVTMRTGV